MGSSLAALVILNLLTHASILTWLCFVNLEITYDCYNIYVKRLLLSITVLLVAVFVALPVRTQAQDVNNFTISTFEADYVLSRDANGVGTLQVEERIVAEFPEFDQNRGLERSIPQEYEGFSLELNIESVTDEAGVDYRYTTYESNDHTVIRIGDPNSYARGTTEYNIVYSVQNVITFKDDKDAFVWDVNGTDWRVPIDNVGVKVKLDPSIASRQTGEAKCFTGVFGATAFNCTVEQGTDVIMVNTSVALNQYENMTISLDFEDGTFAQDKSQLYKKYALYAWAAVLPLASLVVMGRKWWHEGRDIGMRDVIVPQYVPPEDLNVLEASMIINYKLKPADISAQIIALATAGYITLHETKKDKLIGKDKQEYELELIKSVSDISTQEQTLVQKLFGSVDQVGSKVKLEDKAHALNSTLTSMSRSLAKSLTSKKYFRSNPQNIVGIHVAIGFVVAIGLVILGGIIEFIPLIVSGILSGLIIVSFGFAMPALSKKGSTAKEYLLGVEDYVKLAEADRIKYLQSPEGASRYGDPTDTGTKIKLYETLLPFAMLFGLEKQWAKEFSDLYGNEQPSWINSQGVFSANSLSDSMNGFSSATATAFSPSSNSSSGGGGFSGGGGGGGGGGGW